VKGRALAGGWIVMVLAVLAALGWTVAQTISFGKSGATAGTQRAGLARELEAVDVAAVDLTRPERVEQMGASHVEAEALRHLQAPAGHGRPGPDRRGAAAHPPPSPGPGSSGCP